MKKLPAMMLYPGDWHRMMTGVSPLAQYLFLKMRFIAHDSDRYGYLSSNGSPIQPEIVAAKCNLDVALYETLLTELFAHAIPERTPENIIFIPDMVEADKDRKAAIRYGRKGGNPQLLDAGLNHRVNPPDNLLLEDEDENELPKNLKMPEFRAAWLLWREHRREIRKKMTPTARKLQFSKLSELGPDRAVAAIQHSIRSGYTGIYEPSSNGSAKNGQVKKTSPPPVRTAQVYGEI